MGESQTRKKHTGIFFKGNVDREMVLSVPNRNFFEVRFGKDKMENSRILFNLVSELIGYHIGCSVTTVTFVNNGFFLRCYSSTVTRRIFVKFYMPCVLSST